MKNIVKYTLPAIAMAGILTSCEPELDVPTASAGSASFERYVALGNSLTAGYTDNALYRAGQEVAFPNILAQQFSLAGGGEFKQPLITVGSQGDIGLAFSDTGQPISRLVLGPTTDCRGATSLGPVRAHTSGDLSILTSIASAGPYNNLGIPGAKSFHLRLPGYGDPAAIATGNANPFFTRFATSSTTTVLQDALAQNPSFFTLWIGNMDVLGYATSGGTGELNNFGSNDITPATVFQANIDSVVTRLTASGAKGVIANIINITSAPYFTTVPYNGLVLTRQGQADSLNMAYMGTGITFTVGQNPFIIADGASAAGLRQIKSTERVLLSIPQDSIKCARWGSVTPIPNRYVLTENELNNINNATQVYNTILKNAADAKGLAFADMHSYMQTVQPGVYSHGVANSTTFVTGNLFSLDGLHLTPRGNAFVANEFIRVINSKYGANIPQVNPNSYSGVRFP